MKNEPVKKEPQWARMIESRFPDFFDFGRRGEVMMRVEELEDDGHKIVRAELPGMDPDDIDIRVEQGRLFIRAQREEKKEDRDDTRYRSEFRYGSYERSFALPAGASEDDVKATYVDGILEVRVPVDPAVSEARKIPIAHH